MADVNFTNVLKTEDRKTSLDINNGFVDLLPITSWSFSATTITLTVDTGHGIVATDHIWVQGLLSTTNAPNGDWLVSSVTTTTIVFTANSTPTGTPTIDYAIVYKTTYADAGLLGTPDTGFSSTGARKYSDGTIRGKSSYGEYVKYPDGILECTIVTDELTCEVLIGSLYTTDNTTTGETYNYPHLFIEDPFVVGNAFRDAGATRLRGLNIGVRSVTSVTVKPWSATSDIFEHVSEIKAIGEWK